MTSSIQVWMGSRIVLQPLAQHSRERGDIPSVEAPGRKRPIMRTTQNRMTQEAAFGIQHGLLLREPDIGGSLSRVAPPPPPHRKIRRATPIMVRGMALDDTWNHDGGIGSVGGLQTRGLTRLRRGGGLVVVRSEQAAAESAKPRRVKIAAGDVLRAPTVLATDSTALPPHAQAPRPSWKGGNVLRIPGVSALRREGERDERKKG